MRKSNFLLILILILFAVFYTGINAKENRVFFERITTDDGLSQNTIYSIIQDSDGFMWFATDYGLNKYDGYTFKSFFSGNDDNSLWDNKVQALSNGENGILWIGTKKGLNIYDRNRDKIKRIVIPTGMSKNILSFCKDRKNNMWIGTVNGIIKLNYTNRKYNYDFKYYDKTNGLSNNYINRIFINSKGKIYIATQSGLNLYNSKKDIFEVIKGKLESKEKITKTNITAFFEDSNGNIWIGTEGFRVFIKYNNTDYFKKLNFGRKSQKRNSMVISFLEDTFKNVWIGTNGCGLLRYNEKREVESFNGNFFNNSLVSSNYILSMFESNEGILWIGTANGLDRINIKGRKFVHWDLKKFSNQYSINNNIWSFYKEEKSSLMWLGTENGVLRFFKEDGKYKVVSDINKVSDYIIMAITKFSDILFVGTNRHGLFGYDCVKKTVKHFTEKKDGLKGKSVYSLYSGKDNLLIGTDSGLSVYNNSQERFYNYMYYEEKFNFANKSSVYTVFTDRKGTIWVGGKSGLFYLNKKKGKLVKIILNRKNPLLNDIRILYITEGKDGKLLLGSDSGLIVFSKRRNEIELFTVNDGLPGNDIYGIIESGDCFWISTNNGISKFNPRQKIFKNFTKLDGLQNKEFNSGACFKAGDGEIYFGGVNGFNSFYPNRILKNNKIPKIVITSIKIFDKELAKPYNFNKRGEFCLKYNRNFISFEFSALDFTVPKKNKYRFKMVGIDKEWTERASDRRFANYTDLSPGHYIFIVKGSNNDGVWNDTGTSMKIYISPPIWMTWWAYTLYTLLFFLLFIIGHKIRVRQLKARKRELAIEVERRTLELEEANLEIKTINEELEKSMFDLSDMNRELKEANLLKSEFLGIAAHDLKNPLQVILGYTDLLRMRLRANNLETKEIKKINNSVEKMLLLIKDLLKTASLDIGKLKLHLEKIEICEIMRRTVEANGPLATKKNQNIIYTAKNKVNIKGDSAKIMQIFDNLVSNAIKYTPLEKNLYIDIERRIEKAIIKVRDNGPGFTDEDKKHLFKKFKRLSAKPTGGESSTGLGLAICKQYVELHSGKIFVESEYGKGSTFVVEFPIIED